MIDWAEVVLNFFMAWSIFANIALTIIGLVWVVRVVW